MFGDRREAIALETNFDGLCQSVMSELQPSEKGAYSRPTENADDLIKWKQPKDALLEKLGGEADLLERVARIDRLVKDRKSVV